MEDDGEQLDWGGEDDEHYGEHGRGRDHYDDFDGEHDYRSANGEEGDVPDTVSLGGEEDDIEELAAFQSRSLKDDSHSPTAAPTGSAKSASRDTRVARRDSMDDAAQIEDSPSARRTPDHRRPSETPPLRRRPSQNGPLTHALPPKPISTPAPPFRANSSQNFRGGNSIGVRGQDKDRRRTSNGGASPSSDELAPLPPDWEIRHPRNDPNQMYYFNIVTEVSQWTRPQGRGKQAQGGKDGRDDDYPQDDQDDYYSDDREDDRLASRDVRKPPFTPAGVSKDRMSFGDRHYRPKGADDLSKPQRPPPHRQQQHRDRGDYSDEEPVPVSRQLRRASPPPAAYGGRGAGEVDIAARPRRGSFSGANDSQTRGPAKNWGNRNQRLQNQTNPAPPFAAQNRPSAGTVNKFGDRDVGPPARAGFRNQGYREHDEEPALPPSHTQRSTLSAPPSLLAAIRGWFPHFLVDCSLRKMTFLACIFMVPIITLHNHSRGGPPF